MQLSEKCLWLLFLLVIVLAFGNSTSLFSANWLTLPITIIPLALLLVHAFKAFRWRGVAFVFFAGFCGFIAEAISLNHGTLFGGEYRYNAGGQLWRVPISVTIYWAIFIYLGYWLVNTYLFWLGKEKPEKKNGNLTKLAMLVITSSLAVVAIDMLMDPVEIRAGAWTWINGGSYFGVPIGNFIGWFCVAVVAIGIFRLFEYYRPQIRPKFNMTTYLLPVLSYLLVAVYFLLGELKYRLTWLIIIGLLITVLPALINLVFFYKNRALVADFSGSKSSKSDRGQEK